MMMEMITIQGLKFFLTQELILLRLQLMHLGELESLI